MDWIQTIVGAIIGGIVAGGAISAVGYRALKDKLIGDLKEGVFASDSKVNTLVENVSAIETLYVQVRERLDVHGEEIVRLQETGKHLWQPLRERLDSIAERLDKHDRLINRTVVLLDEIEKRFNRLKTG